jgi:hypothetical protein
VESVLRRRRRWRRRQRQRWWRLWRVWRVRIGRLWRVLKPVGGRQQDAVQGRELEKSQGWLRTSRSISRERTGGYRHLHRTV